MAAPGKYTPSFSFSGYQATQPDRPLPGPRHDTEYFNIAYSLGQTIDALNDIRRDDGHLENGIVDWESLDPELGQSLYPDAPSDGLIYGRLNAQWTPVIPVGIGDTLPGTARAGELFWENDSGNLFVRYQDSDSAQWVQVNMTAPTLMSGESPFVTPEMFGAIGNGVVDDTAALVLASASAVSLKTSMLCNNSYLIASDQTLNTLIAFGPYGQIKAASGVTVTLAGGFEAPPTAHVFDISGGGFIWPTKASVLTQYHYGAVNDKAVDSTTALQATIDAYYYFMRSDAVRFIAGVHRTTRPLMVNYGAAAGSISIIGPNPNYDGTAAFVGLRIYSDHWGCCFEGQGLRQTTFEKMSLVGPFRAHISGRLFGNGVALSDPYPLENWLPHPSMTATNPDFPNAGTTAPRDVLGRYKMCCGIHLDSRCGTKPAPPAGAVKTAVRLMVTSGALATEFENGDTADGLTLATGDRFLYNAPLDEVGDVGHRNNGIYIVQATGPAVRATDMSVATGVNGFLDAIVPVTAGTYAGTQWLCNRSALGTIGTDRVMFVQTDGNICYPDYAYPSWTGIVTQYGKALSTMVEIRDCQIDGFGAAFGVKGCDAEGNADFTRMVSCIATYNVYTMTWGNTQARMNAAVNNSFGIARVHFSTGVIGRQTGKPHITAVNTCLGNCLDVLDIRNADIGGGALLDNCYGEGTNRIGSYKCTANPVSALAIVGGQWGFHHDWWWRKPAYIIDADVCGVSILGGANFGSMAVPLIIKAAPSLCTLEVTISNATWMTGASNPASITPAEAIMRHSTCDVVFTNDLANQGPWQGKGSANAMYTPSTGATRTGKLFGDHCLSSVTLPIPFCARTAAADGTTSHSSHGIPVSLGGWTFGHVFGGAILTAPSQTGQTLTITLNSVPTLSNAQQQAWVKGSIMFDQTTRNVFVVTDLVGATMTLKQLNNLDFTTNVPFYPSANPNNVKFIATGHYTPAVGLELTYTSGSANVTFTRPDGTTSDNAQLPVGAARVANGVHDAMMPVTAAGSAITASAAGTITFAANARLTRVERAELFYIPRP